MKVSDEDIADCWLEHSPQRGGMKGEGPSHPPANTKRRWRRMRQRRSDLS
jgi:hypothetical protein